MYSSILVHNLGPLKNVSLDLSADFSVIIGPQASGKSTLGKIIYFCKKIRDYAIDFTGEEEMFLSNSIDDIYESFIRKLRSKYKEFFNTIEYTSSEDFYIRYNYSEYIFVELKPDKKGFIDFIFSSKLGNGLKQIFISINDFKKNQEKNMGNRLNSVAFQKFWQLQSTRQITSEWFDEVFYENPLSYQEIIYIPAGRGILSLLANQINSVSALTFDIPIKDFIERVQIEKARFNKSLDKVIEEYEKTEKEVFYKDDIKFAQDIIRKILKADYINDPDGEKLYFNSNNWVRLIYGSSGQQESLWILLLMFSLILEHKKAFVILEEPEANVYPNAQLDIIKLIALTLNSTKSQFFVTTHSPYIMTSANLLIHSGQVENNILNDKEKAVIPKSLRIDPKITAAYKVMDSGNELHNIRDPETGMFDASEIDAISDIIGEATDKLIDLEIEHECRE